MYEAEITLPVTPPFRLDLTAWVLRRRAKNIVDNWDGQAYRRVVTTTRPVLITATENTDRLKVNLKSTQKLAATEQKELVELIKKLLGVKVNLEPFYKMTDKDPSLSLLAEQFKGVKPPQFPTIFETLVNAIACQQVSLDVGILLLNRLAQNFGAEFTDGETKLHAFPAPEDLLSVSEDALKQLGFSRQKAHAIWNLAYSIANGDIDLKKLENVSNEEAVTYLSSLRGIGRWSAEYVLLRGLGRLDIFPGDDIGGQNNIQRLLSLETRPAYDELRTMTSKWQPYAGLIYFHLLLNKLHEKGVV